MIPAAAAWRPALLQRGRAPQSALRPWLEERGSLTARIKAHCRDFRVQCLRQCLEPVGVEEAASLGLPIGTRVWVREVLLLADGVPVVFAHTAMPWQPRHPFDTRFGALGQRSLGSLLFADPRIARGRLEFRALDCRHRLYRRAEASLGTQPERLWARRSRFGRGAKGLLVNEVFLPAILALMPRPA